MVARNNFRGLRFGRSLCFRTTSVAVVDGLEIRSPWTQGRELTFIITTVLVSGAAVTFMISGKRIVDGVWEALKEPNGTTDLTFDPALSVFNGKTDTSLVFGTLDLSMIDTDKYASIRISASVTGAALAKQVNVVHVIGDLYEGQHLVTDSLWPRQKYGSS